MNNRTQSRYGVSYDVSFPQFPSFNPTPQWIRLTQHQGKQDVMELSFGSFNSFYQKVLKTGVLIKVTWETEYAKGEWFGHVYNSDAITQATVKRNLLMRAIGASFPLKEGGNKIWRNKTAPDIVKDICKKRKIKAVVGQSAVKFPMQSLVGISEWEKIQELANRIGFVAHMTNTTLYFQRVDKMIDKFSSIIPVMSYHDGDVNAGVVFEGQTLDKFTAKVGDLFEVGDYHKKTKTVHGINPNTGKSHSHTAKPDKVGKNIKINVSAALFNKVETTVVAETKHIAKELSEGLAHLVRFSFHGHGEGQGDPRIAPYRTVEINGTGETTDGFWVIKDVTHFMTYDGRYTVEFSCMTDGSGNNKTGPFRKTEATVIGTRDVAYEMATGSTQAPASTTIRSTQPLLKETDGGFTLTPDRWVGN